MKVLFLLLRYDKDGLYDELVQEFYLRGNEVYIATITEKKYGAETNLSEENGIKILKIKTGNMFEVGFVEKGITTLSLGNLFKNNIKKYWKNIKFDLVISHTPPITFTPVIKWLKQNYEIKSYLILRDIFPQNAKDLGIIKNNFLFQLFRYKEKQLYKYSDYIGCMSEGNIEFLKKQDPEIDAEKLHILRNWGKIKEKIKINKNEIRKKYLYKENDFIVVFGGNMGRPQGLEFLLNLAEKNITNENIKFLFVGKGNEKEKLKAITKDKKLFNVRFIDFIPREDYEKLISACDVGIVSLHSCFTIPNIPSKTIDYFKLSLPILAFTDKNTDYPIILEKESKGGLSCFYGDLESAQKKLIELYSDEDLRKQLGNNGRKYYEEYLGVDKAYETIMSKINKK